MHNQLLYDTRYEPRNNIVHHKYRTLKVIELYKLLFVDSLILDTMKMVEGNYLISNLQGGTHPSTNMLDTRKSMLSVKIKICVECMVTY